MKAEYINPFLASTVSVFRTMLNVELERGAPFLRKDFIPQYEVTGIIGLTGQTTGTVAVSMPGEMAMGITEALLGERPAEVNMQVVDAVGELTNMIVGAAKVELEYLQLRLGLPTVITGRNTFIAYPTRATPISIPFKSPLGPLNVEVGILA